MEEENEIKIEYEESNKTDPLNQPCDLADPKSEPCARTQMEDNLENRDVERMVVPISKSHENLNTEQQQQQQGKEDSYEDEATTWYKAVDSFGKYICNFCDRTYTVLTSLRYHVKTKHPSEVTALKKNILNKRRKSQPLCHLCKKRFKNLSGLTSHIKNHEIENVGNSCRFCNAAFNNTQELVQHLKTNHNELHKKLHICNTCGYRTNKLSHFKQHGNTHLKEKCLLCPYCDYATNHSSNLKNHVRIHTKDKPFLCDFEGCGSSFTDMTGLSFHVQKHYPEKNMLHCDKCSYKTVYRPSLKVHVEGHMRR